MCFIRRQELGQGQSQCKKHRVFRIYFIGQKKVLLKCHTVDGNIDFVWLKVHFRTTSWKKSQTLNAYSQ